MRINGSRPRSILNRGRGMAGNRGATLGASLRSLICRVRRQRGAQRSPVAGCPRDRATVLGNIDSRADPTVYEWFVSKPWDDMEVSVQSSPIVPSEEIAVRSEEIIRASRALRSSFRVDNHSCAVRSNGEVRWAIGAKPPAPGRTSGSKPQEERVSASRVEAKKQKSSRMNTSASEAHVRSQKGQPGTLTE